MKEKGREEKRREEQHRIIIIIIIQIRYKLQHPDAIFTRHVCVFYLNAADITSIITVDYNVIFIFNYTSYFLY